LFENEKIACENCMHIQCVVGIFPEQTLDILSAINTIT